MPESRRTALLGILIVALPALALVFKLPSHPQIFGVLNNAAHAPVFGALAIAIFCLLRRFSVLAQWHRFLAAFVFAIAMGGAIEVIQPLFGRGAELGDWLNDALGAGAGLALVAHQASKRRAFLAVALGLLVPIAWPVVDAARAYASRADNFPVLFGDATHSDRYFTSTRGVETAHSTLPEQWARAGDPESLRVRVVGRKWPGVTLSEPQPDWRQYSRLMIDLTNPETRPLALTLRVHDFAHNNLAADRFNINLELPGSRRQTVIVPLEEIEMAPADRRMDLSRIAGLIIFGAGDPASIGRHYYITRLWLE
jgi:VanZ family protein